MMQGKRAKVTSRCGARGPKQLGQEMQHNAEMKAWIEMGDAGTDGETHKTRRGDEARALRFGSRRRPTLSQRQSSPLMSCCWIENEWPYFGVETSAIV